MGKAKLAPIGEAFAKAKLATGASFYEVVGKVGKAECGEITSQTPIRKMLFS